MMRILTFSVALCLVTSVPAAFAEPIELPYREQADQAVQSWLDSHVADLVSMYKHVHSHPELSLHETETAALVAKELQACGFEVTTGVGGNGVVAVLRNGDGPTVLIRGDMDALPVIEETGLPYASQVRVQGEGGATVGVMHACGHDIHTTTLIGTGRVLSELRDQWQGTALLIAQPAEELGKGARMMIADGLFERFPKPDFCIAEHVTHSQPIGEIGYTPGWAMANVDSVDVIIYGRGGHGARPHEAVDPIVAAADFVTAVQTLVSRRIDPVESGVVTVGSIHGGSKHNIIPDEVKLQLTVRSYTDEVRQQLLSGIQKVAVGVSSAHACPKAPMVTVLDEFTPAAYNDPDLTAGAAELLGRMLGKENIRERKPEMGGEDFGLYARTLDVPGFMFRVGTASREAYEASLRPGRPQLPGIHSSTFAPLPEPTLRTGIRAMSNLAMSLLAP